MCPKVYPGLQSFTPSGNAPPLDQILLAARTLPTRAWSICVRCVTRTHSNFTAGGRAAQLCVYPGAADRSSALDCEARGRAQTSQWVSCVVPRAAEILRKTHEGSTHIRHDRRTHDATPLQNQKLPLWRSTLIFHASLDASDGRTASSSAYRKAPTQVNYRHGPETLYCDHGGVVAFSAPNHVRNVNLLRARRTEESGGEPRGTEFIHVWCCLE